MENYRRITKPNARKMYNAGFNIALLPCKVSGAVLNIPPSFNSGVQPVFINILTSKNEENKFDRAVNEFEYYNCNAELGYYSHYYISVEDLERYKNRDSLCKLKGGN